VVKVSNLLAILCRITDTIAIFTFRQVFKTGCTKMAAFPSIFNDVIGPAMRGPSSSHCAGALRIGRICRDLMDGKISQVRVFMDPGGSLATTHESQGSDMGLMGGLLGWDATDERLSVVADYLSEKGLQVTFEIRDLGASHPNTYGLVLEGPTGPCHLTALSTGGGMIEITEIDGRNLSMKGDCHETLIYCGHPDPVHPILKAKMDFDEILLHPGRETILEVKSATAPSREFLEDVKQMDGVRLIRSARPVLPVLSRKGTSVPFLSAGEMTDYNREKDLTLWELGARYESLRADIPEAAVYAKMEVLAGYMEEAVQAGLQGTSYEDRILGSQSPAFQEKLEKGQLIGGDLSNRIILYTTAVMEVKSAMGLIVAAPTAGACGTLPGAILATADSLDLSRDQVVKALLAAGMVGIFIARHATFAAESGGCQAECGAASGMAAAALVSMAGGSTVQALAASSLALQNSLGMICDPIANRVEAPCLGKNVMAAMNALSCANMALAGYEQLIPLDEVIQTMNEVGASLPATLRCTALGGLSMTPAARKIEQALKDKIKNTKP
jgi:L-serine dehydratase